MPFIGFHASHAQFAPSALLQLAQRAESAGFEALFSSAHFHPWSESQAQAGKFVRPGRLRKNLCISADLERHLGWLEEDGSFGFEEIFLHDVGTNQEEFIDAFAGSVLPRLRACRLSCALRLSAA